MALRKYFPVHLQESLYDFMCFHGTVSLPSGILNISDFVDQED
ncbi:hypothetical protein [Paludibacterium denitrificans]|nr:hypothetical protein [Paludibacterium denitrificans]